MGVRAARAATTKLAIGPGFAYLGDSVRSGAASAASAIDVRRFIICWLGWEPSTVGMRAQAEAPHERGKGSGLIRISSGQQSNARDLFAARE